MGGGGGHRRLSTMGTVVEEVVGLVVIGADTDLVQKVEVIFANGAIERS